MVVIVKRPKGIQLLLQLPVGETVCAVTIDVIGLRCWPKHPHSTDLAISWKNEFLAIDCFVPWWKRHPLKHIYCLKVLGMNYTTSPHVKRANLRHSKIFHRTPQMPSWRKNSTFSVTVRNRRQTAVKNWES